MPASLRIRLAIDEGHIPGTWNAVGFFIESIEEDLQIGVVSVHASWTVVKTQCDPCVPIGALHPTASGRFRYQSSPRSKDDHGAALERPLHQNVGSKSDAVARYSPSVSCVGLNYNWCFCHLETDIDVAF